MKKWQKWLGGLFLQSFSEGIGTSFPFVYFLTAPKVTAGKINTKKLFFEFGKICNNQSYSTVQLYFMKKLKNWQNQWPPNRPSSIQWTAAWVGSGVGVGGDGPRTTTPFSCARTRWTAGWSGGGEKLKKTELKLKISRGCWGGWVWEAVKIRMRKFGYPREELTWKSGFMRQNCPGTFATQLEFVEQNSIEPDP